MGVTLLEAKKARYRKLDLDSWRGFQYIRRSLLVTDDVHHGAAKQQKPQETFSCLLFKINKLE
ncbi:MAG: hypothetical protein D3910_27185 [Candidatus Electrothrix sp. ATG2]|nr:hypothetical protein [Candidatus Electrothrix sp. ATG2]